MIDFKLKLRQNQGMKHELTNQEVLQILKEVLASMEVKGENFFKIRAYQNAIVSIEHLTNSVYELWENDRLDEITGVGSTLKQHLQELFSTGKVKEFEQKIKDLPQGMFSLIGLRKVGAKTAYKLATNFNLNNRETALDEVKKLAENHKIQVLPGFGAKSEKDILDAIENLKFNKSEKQRTMISKAEKIVERIKDYMQQNSEITYCEAMGSFRRRSATIGDLDFAVASEKEESAIQYFLKFPEIKEILGQGEKKASVVLKNDLQVDVRVIKKNELGSMLQYFTGNMQHNVQLRTYALQNEMSISEYGIKYKGILEEFENEKDFYKRLGLSYIEPELRQGKNEIELAKKGELPKLVQLQDIKGDLHTHSTYSDGENSIEEMVKKAISLGYEYYGITDHAPSVSQRGMDEVKKIISNLRKEIDYLQKKYQEIKIFYGYEVNILADKSLGLPDELLQDLDYVIASIHTSFEMDRETMTERILSALQNPYVKILGHPSGRLINERPSIDVNWTKIFEFASKNGKIIEINSQPQRLDLPEDLVYEARKQGCQFIINTDAHNKDSMEFTRYGVDVARRGFCQKIDIINTLPVDKFLKKIYNN